MLLNEVHPLKALSPMSVTDDGISKLANALHPKKAESPMLVTDGVISINELNTTVVNELHSLKALSSINLTDAGISTVANELHPSNTSLRTLVTDDGSIT